MGRWQGAEEGPPPARWEGMEWIQIVVTRAPGRAHGNPCAYPISEHSETPTRSERAYASKGDKAVLNAPLVRSDH
jgi:hypothetical protein